MHSNQNKLHQTFEQAAMSMADASRLNQLWRVDLQCGCGHACHQLISHCVIVFFFAPGRIFPHITVSHQSEVEMYDANPKCVTPPIV